MHKPVEEHAAVNMSVQLGSVAMANPVLTASGTCGYAFELADFVDLGQLGGFVTKSVTQEERAGNPPQRTYETPAGMLNSIGLANVGLERFAESLRAQGAPVIQVDWRPPASGDERLMAILKRMREG